MNIHDWIVDMAAVFNYRLGERQLEIYEDELSNLHLSEAELESLKRQIRQELDRFPSLAQLWAMGNSMRRTKNATEPRWRTWRDRKGCFYAQKLSGRQALAPTDEDLELWKREACSVEEGKAAFAKAYLKASGKPELLVKMQGLVAAREAVEGKRIEDEMGVDDFDWGKWPK